MTNHTPSTSATPAAKTTLLCLDLGTNTGWATGTMGAMKNHPSINSRMPLEAK